MNIPDFSSFLGSLNNQGFLLMKGPKVYQLQTSDYWDITVYIMQQQSLTASLDDLKTSDIKQTKTDKGVIVGVMCCTIEMNWVKV